MDRRITVLVAEDDANDALLLKLAASKAHLDVALDFVQNGREAIHYLSQYFDSGFFDNQLSLVFIELCLHANNHDLARWELERALHWDPKSVELNSFDQVLRQHGH